MTDTVKMRVRIEITTSLTEGPLTPLRVLLWQLCKETPLYTIWHVLCRSSTTYLCFYTALRNLCPCVAGAFKNIQITRTKTSRLRTSHCRSHKCLATRGSDPWHIWLYICDLYQSADHVDNCNFINLQPGGRLSERLKEDHNVMNFKKTIYSCYRKLYDNPIWDGL